MTVDVIENGALSGKEMNEQAYIEKEVHRLYWEHDTNCARTTLHCLAGLMNIEIEEQTWAAAVGLHGAGGFRAQCGLVEGGLMFIGILGAEKKLSRDERVGLCQKYAAEFTERFGSLRCLELRPSGFSADDPPHMCERLTCDAIAFTYEFINRI